MKTIGPHVLLLIAVVLTGCADRKAAEEKARADAAAKARAEAARKEMQTLSQVFRPQYHNKRLEPEPKAGTPTTHVEPPKKP